MRSEPQQDPSKIVLFAISEFNTQYHPLCKEKYECAVGMLCYMCTYSLKCSQLSRTSVHIRKNNDMKPDMINWI